MTPLARYHAMLREPDFVHDSAQAHAVAHLDRLHQALAAEAVAAREGIIRRIRARLANMRREPVRGLYLWGGVGRGKTFLMDLFFECLPTQHKRRYHFHRFMHRVHHELKALRYEQDPLQIVAQRLASEAQVLCFDELFVSDIADAMILGGLFEYLFQNSVCLVATSNVLPGDLYREGLQRQRFLPAIALLERYTEVVNVDSGTDYRLRVLEKAEIYHHPLDQAAEDNLKESFRRLAPEPGIVGHVLEICGRPMRSTCCADDVVWFDFRELCDSPRSQNDYIELAQTYHAVLVSGVRQFNEETNDQARRFISLVDEFYDRGVKLILSAAVSVEALYRGKRLAFEFERTKSRLQEMQTHDYLARPHRP